MLAQASTCYNVHTWVDPRPSDHHHFHECIYIALRFAAGIARPCSKQDHPHAPSNHALLAEAVVPKPE
eukprot:8712104-Prorocentrum_lima.AAC.1